MFGVFMKRWKPKRISNNERDESPGTDGNVSPEPPDRPPGKVRQVHPEEKTQVLAYDSTYRKKNKPKNLPLEENHYNHLANTNVAMSPMYPLTPNICVEGGKIEFIKSPPGSARNSLALASPPQTPLLARRGSREKREARIYDEPTEKFDGDKELLEKRIKQLEAQLEEEKRRTQRERMAVTKLQNKLIKREGAARSDAERERRARGDWEARARAAEADATRLAAKLHAAQREITRMEETVRSLLQYKSRVETLKQEKASLSSALEASAAHYQSQLSTLSSENERLQSQLSACTAGLGTGDHERRLDDVAQQVVRALLSQKDDCSQSVREELGCARARIRELEAQNRALSSLLVRQLRPQPRPSPATPHTPLTPHTPRDLQVHLVDVGSCGSLVSFRDSPPPAPPVSHPHPLSQDDKRRHQILADIWTELKGLEVTPANLARALSAVDPTLWAPPARPATLSLSMPQPCTDPVRGESEGKVTEEESGEVGEAGAESPESGAKDEGYSTMSSDVQADASRQSDHAADRALPDLNEASDETDNQTIVSINPRESRRHARLLAAEADYIYFPIGVAFAGVRGSYPPSRPVLPFQHVVRSFSDSHLCLKLIAGTTCPTSCLDSPTPSSGVLVLDLKPSPERPLRRPAIASTTSSERVSWGSTLDDRADGSQYDADYVQHWLELDDARSALQQRHRDLADLEYDRAELEDWSLSLSCEDLRDRQSPFAEITTPGQISLSTLPSIREDDALELEEDVGDCLWNDCGFATIEIDECRIADDADTSEKRWDCTGTHSPGGSWSSASDAPDKRSSTALSEDGDCANVGLDFTRDFYRLVKYESTKSLASNSSRGIPAQDTSSHLRIHDVQAMALQDREQALQNVLHFIAEQQKYCRDREESDSMSSRPLSEIRELPPPYATADFDDDSVGPRSEVSEDRQRPDSFGSFSENDSCDVLPGDRPRIAFCDTVSEPRSTPRFIEREEPYAESEDFFDEFSRVENAENEIDEHHLIKVQRKNEINKSIDVISSTPEIEDQLPVVKDEKPSDIESSRSLDYNSALKENTVNIMLNKQSPVERVELEPSLTKSSSFPYSGNDEMSLVEEVLSACRRSTGALLTVPEEEEGSSPETSSPQMTESNTTSTSTAETVIVSNKNDTPKERLRERSRIPTLLGGKRPPSSPNRNRSKIPVAERRPGPPPAPVVPEPIIVKQEHTLSFHEAATSKDVIEELNRMIRQSEAAVSSGDVKAEEKGDAAHKDAALWAPTGWVHVEKDIDFSDPKARANLLDVMLASSDSSPSSCGSSPAEPPLPYSRLHRLHRSRRQKTAAALRVRGPALRGARARRPSILGRDGFFVRYGEREIAAVATFDFLDDLSGGSSPEAPKDCT
ncbi:uncharacterized protein LOC142972194 isoform X3 [Anticarsia gemmatalis]|uniref:uncharacterized protein LOC142972194 isoform X3 n=1 Tax=Anticarsia gemmatalis TaxID=129554 RepID=UPI003F773665